VFGALWESGLGNFGFGRVVGRVARVPMQSVMLNRLNITDETDARDMAEYVPIIPRHLRHATPPCIG
jgi:hypothetical protein